jgi:hypothetical protein
VRKAFFLFILVDHTARMVKAESGRKAPFGEDGALKVGQHKGARDGRNVALGFEDLAADAQDEILKIANLRDALIFAEIDHAAPAECLAAALA